MAPGRRAGWRGLAAALLLATAGLPPPAGAAPPADDAVLPADEHAAGEARALAEEYAGELRQLRGELTPCAAGLAVQRHGIAFRRPQGQPDGPPYLTLWVWVEPGRSPAGSTLAARAAAAFARHGRPLFARLLGRSALFAEPRVGGYALILTWLAPETRGGRLVGESVAVFADKVTVANFVHETIAPAEFLARAHLRAFDGQAELAAPALALADRPSGAPPGC